MGQEEKEGEIRTDFLGRSAILTPSRASRPHDFTPQVPQKNQDTSKCFFCPGNEHLTPPEIDRTQIIGKSGWQNRVFCNKFPALSKDWKNARGTHEVIVETGEHRNTLSQLSDGQLAQYLEMVAKRIKFHEKNKNLKFISVFKNEWKDAGASLEHTHTQLVAMPFVPNITKIEQKASSSPCKFCKLKNDNKYSKVISNGDFLLLSPHVPLHNYEMWILPKKHIASISQLDEISIFELAQTLGIAIRTQDALLNYPAYNILFHLSPLRTKNFHFHIQICPRISTWAGFELSTGVIMNSTRPEFAAKEFRENLKI